MANGTITKVFPAEDRRFGFIAQADGQPDAFFHAQDLSEDLDFDERLVEQRVVFDVEAGTKGPRARNVRAAR